MIFMNKYFSIYTELKQQITTGLYHPHTYLPSEQILADSFHASRETVRKALRLLAEEGYIQKKERKGNMVLDVKKFVLSSSLLSNYREFEQSQNQPKLKSETIVVDFKTIPYPKFLQERIDLIDNPDMYYILRQRKIDHEVIILDKDYVVQHRVPSLTKEIVQHSLYDYIEHDLGLSLSYARKEITVEPATQEDRIYMELHNDTHVVVVRSEVYLEDSSFIQHTESRHRLDKFRVVEFARRRNHG